MARPLGTALDACLCRWTHPGLRNSIPGQYSLLVWGRAEARAQVPDCPLALLPTPFPLLPQLTIASAPLTLTSSARSG